MNGAYYRLNIRFDLTDKRQREIVERLQAIDKNNTVLSTNSLLPLSARYLT